MKLLINLIQKPVSTDAERYLLVYMIGVLAILTGLIILFFVVFQKRKNKLLLERIEREQAFEAEILKTQSEIQEETLKHVGRELHDNIGQLLSYANMQINMILTKAPEGLQQSLRSTSETLSQGVSEIRELSKSLNNDVFKNVGFKMSLLNEIKRLRKLNFESVTLDIMGNEQPLENSKHELVMFRILQEFFSNAIKYSEATHIKVVLNYRTDHLLIVAEDDGVGFDMNTAEKGSGLINMQSRADLINANLHLESNLKEGVRLSLKYPFSQLKS